MIRRGWYAISKEQVALRKATFDTRRNVWKTVGRGVAKQQMLENLHAVYTRLRERYASEQAMEIARQKSLLTGRGYRLGRGWEEDQSGPESDTDSPPQQVPPVGRVRPSGSVPPRDVAGPSGTAPAGDVAGPSGSELLGALPSPSVSVPPGGVAGPSGTAIPLGGLNVNTFAELMGSDWDSLSPGIPRSSTDPTATQAGAAPAVKRLRLLAEAVRPQTRSPGQEQGTLADPGYVLAYSDGSERRPAISGSAGGDLSLGPGGEAIRLPPSGPVMPDPPGPSQTPAQERRRPRRAATASPQLGVLGQPVPPTLQLEVALHTALLMRNQVREQQGEAEAARQFGYLDDTLTRFMQAGFRVEVLNPTPEGSIDMPQPSGARGGDPQDKGKGPAE